MAIEEKASIDTLLIAAEVLERDIIKPDKNSRSGGRDHYAVNGLSEQVFRSIPYHGETFKNMANKDRRNPGSGTFLAYSRSQFATAPFVAAAAEKRRNSAITPPYFSMNDPYHQSAALAAEDLIQSDLSSLAAGGTTLPQDWLRSLSPQISILSGSKWTQSSVSSSPRTSVPMPSTSTSFSESGEWNPAFHRLSPPLSKSSSPLTFMGLHDLHDRGFSRGDCHGSSTFNGLTSALCRLEADHTKSASKTTSPSSAATSTAANVPHKRLRTALLADRPGALLENRTNGRAYSDITPPWMSATAAASVTRSLVISRDITTSASAEPHRSQTSALVSHESSLLNVTASPSTFTSGRKICRHTDSPVETAVATAGDTDAPAIVKPHSSVPRLPAKKRKIDWSFSDDPPVMPPLKDRGGTKLSLPCDLEGAQRVSGTRQGSPLQPAATAGPVAPLIVDSPAVGLASNSEANERPLASSAVLSQSHLRLIEQTRRKQSESYLLSSSSASGPCLDAAPHSRSPFYASAVGDLSGTRAPPPTSTEAPPPISTRSPQAPQPPRRKLSYPNLLDHMSFNYDASLFLSQLQRQRNLEAELQAALPGESRKEEYGLRTPLVVEVSSDEPRRFKPSQEGGPISRHHHHHQQLNLKPPPVPEISYSPVDHLKAATAVEPTRRSSLAANSVAPADYIKSRQHRHSSISPPQLQHLQQLHSLPLYLYNDYSQSLARSATASKLGAGQPSSNTGRSLLISRSLENSTAAAVEAAVPSPLSSQPPTPGKVRPFSAPENTGSSWPASSLTTASFGYQPQTPTTSPSPAKCSCTESSYDAKVAAAAAIAALSQSNRDPPRERFSGFQELAAASNVATSANEQQLRAGHVPVQGATLSVGRDSKSMEFVRQLALGGLSYEQAYYRKRSLDSLFTNEPRIGAVHNAPSAVSSISEYLAAAAAAAASGGVSQRPVVPPQTDVSAVASGFPLLLFSAPSSASAAALAAETALEWGASPTSLIPVPVEIKSLPSGFLSGKRTSQRHGDDDEGEDGQREAFTFISTNLPSEDSAGSGSGGGGGVGGAGNRSSCQPAPQLIFPVLSSSLKSGSLKKACALGLPMLVPPNAQNLLVNKPKSV
uniref:Uncharacterized protein n=1 Tax=Schistocephalus solidus TaxID=70667 RepID=A0A0X3NNZ2_SCHSO